MFGKPVKIRRGPATVSAEDRSTKATGAEMRWEGSFDPMKRESGDRPGSSQCESTSEERR
jgi:hypothetical protein